MYLTVLHLERIMVLRIRLFAEQGVGTITTVTSGTLLLRPIPIL